MTNNIINIHSSYLSSTHIWTSAGENTILLQGDNKDTDKPEHKCLSLSLSESMIIKLAICKISIF